MQLSQLFAWGRFLQWLRLLGAGAGIVVMGVCFIGYSMYSEISTEIGFHDRFGPEWKDRYEKRYGAGSLSEARTKLVGGTIALPVIGGLIWLLQREIQGKGGSRRRVRRRRN